MNCVNKARVALSVTIGNTEMRAHAFLTFAELNAVFGTADHIGNNVVIFDIGGNKYRISAKVVCDGVQFCRQIGLFAVPQ